MPFDLLCDDEECDFSIVETENKTETAKSSVSCLLLIF